MSGKHSDCRRTAERRFARLSYIIYELQCMKHDDCPALSRISLDDLKRLQTVADEVRRKAWVIRDRHNVSV